MAELDLNNNQMDINNIQEEENIIINNESLISKLPIRDFLGIVNDTVLSIIFILILIIPYNYTSSFCDPNIYLSMKILIYTYISFIIRAIIKLSIFYYNKNKEIKYKIFIFIIEILTSICKYICIFFSFIIYFLSDERCFKIDTFTIFCFITVIFIEAIRFFQFSLNFIFADNCFLFKN